MLRFLYGILLFYYVCQVYTLMHQCIIFELNFVDLGIFFNFAQESLKP